MTAIIIIGVIAAVLAIYWVNDFIFNNTVGRGFDALAARSQGKDTASDLERFKNGRRP